MTDTATAAPATAADRYERFHALREQSVRTPTGFLALVNTQWVSEEQTIWGVPGVWAPRPEAESGLLLTASASDGIRVDGELVDGQVVVRGKDDPAPGAIVFDDHTTGTVIRGEDGQYALRVWDAQSEDIQRFGRIDAFPHNPGWIVTGRFTPNPAGTTVGFSHIKDEGATRELPVPGDIVVTLEGTEYRIAAFRDGNRLQLVFADATSGDDTYGVGRFLFLAPNPDGTITLDFNYAVLPPCAFSYNFNCPMPPKQNRFPFRIEAGEKQVLDREGQPLH
ncbi:DUF1684 domain-containing protein [Amnibacterium sp. CER49]|uniref:DUF1684 domain-containing protein n=1 Tax=Amnibacterium sp. CER49 TaxID=3039161 RepID=UPI002447E580|nr:DUF1684 domain-containing protein [Amnibacterium sp. CER49]MDH2442360.1 DUF1684 domain-containing protein [Amnibacterium sp. CER49]